MADEVVSLVLEQLRSIALQEVKLVVGVKKEVQNLTNNLNLIQALLVDADKKLETEELVKVWLKSLKDISYDISDVLDEWSTAYLKLQIQEAENASMPTKVSSYICLPCFCFNRVVLHRDIAYKVKEFNEKLDMIAKNKYAFNLRPIANIKEPERPPTSSIVDVSEIYGRDQDKDTIVGRLLCESSREEKDLHIISIVGKGGLGKTTLARQVYNDVAVQANFEKKIWVCVSDPFEITRIGKVIVKELDGSDPTSLEWEHLSHQIQESIMRKKFLLVLDDVWTENFDKWEPLRDSLKSGAKESRILVTTRNERVSKMMGTTYVHSLEELSKEACWSFFSQIAFFGKSGEDREKLEEIGRKISNRCKGLPLAAKTLGSLLRCKKTEQDWRNVLDSDIWKLEDPAIMTGLFSPLLLSYYDLPSPLKQCFSYCATFPKDYHIRIEGLILLWMAQGYLHSNGNREMELIGREYFDNLAMRSFFQDFSKDEYGVEIVGCKMHDIVHDFAQFLVKNECFIMEVNGGKVPSTDSFFLEARHSTLILQRETQFPDSIHESKNLRTLIVEPTRFIANALPNLFRGLKYLRALSLSNCSITVLPREVGNLMHLRYLNLAFNRFEWLPETVCDLCNLQTLDLSFCGFLEELPQGMGRLINLRYLNTLNTPSLRDLPKGIGRLSSLRTLIDFIVSGGDNRDREACKLVDLKNLNNLRRSLTITGLGNVVATSEAEEAELKSKTNLHHLILHFDGEGGKGKMEDVIEALQPQPNLESLKIRYYQGTQFPNWIVSLTKLKKLELFFCNNCVHLPCLGKLPFLESLEVRHNKGLKKVGIEFLGLGIGDDNGPIIAFPKLKHLKFVGMEEWGEWEVWDEITIMPCLCSLWIEDCPKLKALPHHLSTSPLEELYIYGCPILRQRCKEGMGEDWPIISHIPSFQIDEWIRMRN